MAKYYIASPFFNEEQVNYCESLENLLTATDNEYYSPRQHGDTQSIDIPEYLNDLKRKLIFKSNIEEILSCDAMIVNLMHKDMGTLFEFGYACGLSLMGKLIEINTVPYTELYIEKDEFDEDKSNSVISRYVVEISKDDTYQLVIDKLSCVDKLNGARLIVDSTNSGDNYALAAFALGICHAISKSVSYVCPVKSVSNLMITESGINQYLTMKDLDNGNQVVYEDSEIR